MSAVAIVSVAAVCAGYLWLERHQVQRAARVRLMERRRCGVMRWCEPGPVHQQASARLERHIEAAVASADVAWSYYERLFVCGAPGESPFQLRRARVDAAQRRFAVAAARLERSAADWVARCEDDRAVDEQSKLAVRRMQEWLVAHPVPARFPVEEASRGVETTVDVLENALANLRQRRIPATEADPFRRVSEASPRQDVIAPLGSMPPRHGGPSSVSATR